MRPAISPGQRLSITLKFLATGESFQSLSFSFRVGRSTVSEIVKETCKALYESMHVEYLKHGHIHLCFKELILEKFDEKTWHMILAQANADENDDFMLFHYYPDDLTNGLLGAAVAVTGVDMHTLLDVYGEYFFTYAARHGYDKMMRTLGTDFVSFVKRLDFLHSLLALTYKGMVPPQFSFERKDDTLYLHYNSKRGGLYPLAIGLLRAVAKHLYHCDAKFTVLKVEQYAPGESQYKEHMLAEVILSQEEKDRDSESELVISAPADNNNSTKEESDVEDDDSYTIGRRSFRQAVPYHLIFDQDLVPRGCGSSLALACPKVKQENVYVNDVFRIIEPDVKFTYSEILDNLNEIFTLIYEPNKDDPSHQGSLALKGHMVKLRVPSHVIFIGSPYFSNLRELLDCNIVITGLAMDNIIRELFFINEQRKAEVEISQRLDSATSNLKKMAIELDKEKRKTDTLLNEMLPPKVANQLREGKVVEAEKFEVSTILFSDIVTFTNISALCQPMQIVAMLNELYQRFDKLTSIHDVYKVETIGDAYMVVSGVPERTDDHALKIANMAIDMVLAASQVRSPATGHPLQVRVGIHSGPVVAGVVGEKMPRFCLFGDTVNTASRMESHGLAGMVHISDDTYILLKNTDTVIEPRGPIDVKGKGIMSTYFIIGNAEKQLTITTPITISLAPEQTPLKDPTEHNEINVCCRAPLNDTIDDGSPATNATTTKAEEKSNMWTKFRKHKSVVCLIQ